MNNDTLKNRIHRLVADQVGEDIDNITDASVLRGDFLGLDDFDMMEIVRHLEVEFNIDMMEIVMSLEVEFNIEVTDDEVERVNTVGDLISIVQGKVSA